MGINSILGECFKATHVNVFDISTKKIVFTGSQNDAAIYTGTSYQNINNALNRKNKIKKKYAIRIVSTKV